MERFEAHLGAAVSYEIEISRIPQRRYLPTAITIPSIPDLGWIGFGPGYLKIEVDAIGKEASPTTELL
jgi:hypothetical protein